MALLTWYWNPLGVLGLTTSAFAWILAYLVYRARPDRRQNRLLALLLAVEGAAGFGGSGLIYVTESSRVAYAAQAMTEIGFPAAMLAYVLFLGTLDTPLVRPLRHPWGVGAISMALVAVPLFVLAFLPQFVAGVEPTPYSQWDGVAGPWKPPLRYALLAIITLGLVVAIHAWRRAAPATAARKRAGIYAIAFGSRDTSLLLLRFLPFVGATALLTQATWNTLYVGYLVLLAYGILKHQLFDIDLKIKWTLKQGTVAAVFVAVFFIVSEAAQEVFSGVAGPLLGILAAGLLVFALAPLQRVADRVASAAMPGVRNTPEYLRYRKFEVYRAAFEGVAADREVTPRERGILDRLRRELDIAEGDARALEAEAMRRARGTT